jgi:3-phenylpropionate/cinnamic acid dioxygenase small subunit
MKDPVAVSADTYSVVQRFVFREAALLDRREYREWLRLLTDDITYRVVAQTTRDAADPAREYAIIDEDVGGLKLRVEQIATPRLTHAENPPSLTRRFVSNLIVSATIDPNEFVVEANLLIYRNRPGVPDGGLYAGERHDVVRRVDGELRLARRLVRLDQTVLYGGPVSTLF